MDTFKSDGKKQSVAPHSVWRTPVPMSTLKPWTKGKTANVENSLSIKVFITVTVHCSLFTGINPSPLLRILRLELMWK